MISTIAAIIVGLILLGLVESITWPSTFPAWSPRIIQTLLVLLVILWILRESGVMTHPLHLS